SDAHGSAEARPEQAPEQPEQAEARTETETSSPSERRVPLRFVWTMDAALRLQVASPAFAEAMGPRTAALIGQPWNETPATLANGEAAPAAPEPAAPEPVAQEPAPESDREPDAAERASMPSAFARGATPEVPQNTADAAQLAILERLPVGILIHRADA